MNKTSAYSVEDDAALRATLVRLLESRGYAGKQYSSSTELFRESRSFEEGLILLDSNMPGPDGFTVQRELADKENRSPIILMTGSRGVALLELKTGATDFMQKSFDWDQLLSVLDDISERRQMDA